MARTHRYLRTQERLVRGKQGPQVRDLQRDLQFLAQRIPAITGPNGIDGIFGPLTAASVASFEEWAGLPVNTTVEAQERAALRKALQDQGIPITPQSPAGFDTGTVVAGVLVTFTVTGLVMAIRSSSGSRSNPGIPDDEARVFERSKDSYNSKSHALSTVVNGGHPGIESEEDVSAIPDTETHYRFREKGL